MPGLLFANTKKTHVISTTWSGCTPNISIICSTSRSPFYSLPTGENSCYWDISGAVLDSLGKNRESKYDYQRDVCHAIDDRFFGPETDYSLEKRQNYMQLRAMGMTPDQPIQGRFVYKLSLPLYFIFLDNCFFASSFISRTLYGVYFPGGSTDR